MNKGKVDVLLGLQWGDEGKGKVVDVMTPKYDVIARFQGGPNAGHTLEFEGQKYVLRSIPSGIFQGGKINIADGKKVKVINKNSDLVAITGEGTLNIGKDAELYVYEAIVF